MAYVSQHGELAPFEVTQHLCRHKRRRCDACIRCFHGWHRCTWCFRTASGLPTIVRPKLRCAACGRFRGPRSSVGDECTRCAGRGFVVLTLFDPDVYGAIL